MISRGIELATDFFTSGLLNKINNAGINKCNVEFLKLQIIFSMQSLYLMEKVKILSPKGFVSIKILKNYDP